MILWSLSKFLKKFDIFFYMFVTKQELNAALGTFKEKKEKDYYAGMC